MGVKRICSLSRFYSSLGKYSSINAGEEFRTALQLNIDAPWISLVAFVGYMQDSKFPIRVMIQGNIHSNGSFSSHTPIDSNGSLVGRIFLSIMTTLESEKQELKPRTQW